MDVIEVLKVLSDETRIRIITLLSRETLCVCEMEAILNLGQSNISRHVTRLKQVKLVVAEKKAQWIYYQVDKRIFAAYPFLTELFQEHFAQLLQCQVDLMRLKEHKESGVDCAVLVKEYRKSV